MLEIGKVKAVIICRMQNDYPYFVTFLKAYVLASPHSDRDRGHLLRPHKVHILTVTSLPRLVIADFHTRDCHTLLLLLVE